MDQHSSYFYFYGCFPFHYAKPASAIRKMAPTGASDTAVDGDGAALGSPTLHVLERRDIQRICSGQSVVDLATAVKELVENALDAGATQLEVKLKEFGRDGLEVSDNGSGIAPSNYDTLARKHYTSKIARFEDIECLTSFGFRCVFG